MLAGIIVAGWDKQNGGQVYQIPLGGMCIRRNYAIGGSGSSYVHGFLREFYRPGMDRNETVQFVKKGKLIDILIAAANVQNKNFNCI